METGKLSTFPFEGKGKKKKKRKRKKSTANHCALGNTKGLS